MLNRVYPYFILAIISGYIVLNSGFMLLRVPPVGPGIPIGELVVLIAWGLLFIESNLLVRFLNRIPALALFLFSAIGIGHLIFDGPSKGFWAFRDAAHLFELTFLWVGFQIATSTARSNLLFKWWKLILRFSVAYVLLYPFREVLAPLGPQITSFGAYSNPLFFSYVNSSTPLVAGVTLALLDSSSITRVLQFCIAILSLVILITLIQVRIAYLQIALIPIFIALFAPRRIIYFVYTLAACVLGVLVFAVLDFDLPARLGTKFSLDFLVNHLQAMWGGGDETVKAAADGVDLRLEWWREIFERTISSPFRLLFGDGFGLPLTSFEGPEGDITREPHNSFMSVLARYGFLGLLGFLTFHCHLFFTAIRAIKSAVISEDEHLRNFLITSTVFLASNLLFSIIEGGFEASYVAIPYYFVAGVIYALAANMETKALT